MIQWVKLFLVVLSLLTGSAQAAERIKVGLALSGGGARGIAHIGILKELERQNIPIDYIAGTSIGSIIGGLYASGKSIAEIEQLLGKIDWKAIFNDSSLRKDTTIRRKFEDEVFQLDKELGYKDGKVQLPSGLIKGQRLQLLLDRLFLDTSGIEHFDQLPIPFRAVATDITTGKAVILEAGSLSTAIRASMSVPSIFSTVKVNDQILVDGGISNNLPIDVVRQMGADVVIAVDIGTPLLAKDKLGTILDVSVQLTNLLVRTTTDRQIETLTERDILIVPDLGNFSSSNFGGASRIIENGAAAAMDASLQLEKLSISLYGDEQLVDLKQISDLRPPVISFIEINDNTGLSDEYIRLRLTQKIGAALDFDQLEKDIAKIYGLDIFSSVTYAIINRPTGSGLVLNAIEKSWGPRYLQFGLSYSSEVIGNNELSVLAGLTIKPLNARNGEWRSLLRAGRESLLSTEIYQPFSIRSSYYFRGNLFLTDEFFNNFNEDINISQTRVRKHGGTIALGREYKRWGDLSLGLTRFKAENDTEIGPPDPSLEDSDGGELFLLGRVDTFDKAFFPTEGGQGALEWISSRSGLGADNEFEQGLFDYLHASSWNTHTYLLGAKYFSTVDGIAPIQSNFRLGGIFNLPGFSTNQLSGQHLYLLRSGYQRQLDNLLGSSPYLGFTLQYGNTFEDKDKISLSDGIAAGGIWLGWDTFIGPVFISYGYAETGDNSVYFSVGNLF